MVSLVIHLPPIHTLFVPWSTSHRRTVCRIMGDSTSGYIRLVQHLIEKCLLFNMSKEGCVDALWKHANVKPVVTSTVWRELEKENRNFFDAYERGREGRSGAPPGNDGIAHAVRNILFSVPNSATNGDV